MARSLPVRRRIQLLKGRKSRRSMSWMFSVSRINDYIVLSQTQTQPRHKTNFQKKRKKCMFRSPKLACLHLFTGRFQHQPNPVEKFFSNVVKMLLVGLLYNKLKCTRCTTWPKCYGHLTTTVRRACWTNPWAFNMGQKPLSIPYFLQP